MSRRQAVWFMVIAALTLVAAFSAPAFPVEEPAQPVSDTPTADSAVEDILRQQEDLLRGQKFGYDPEDRRDPFQSLLIVVNDRTERRPGIRGMAIAEINLDGIIRQDNATTLAFFTGSDNKGYFLRVGDEVHDGKLIAIDAKLGTVTFRQRVDDPRQIKPYRDVTRQLVTTEER